jgi:hypothetical protein
MSALPAHTASRYALRSAGALGPDDSQRELLGQALADAITYRTPDSFCTGCEDHPAGLCDDHAADLDLTDAYLQLGRELGIEVAR